MADQVNDRKIEPEFLGPLGERPLVESARTTSPHDLFPGAQSFLKGRHGDRRRHQWGAVRQLIDRLLRQDEHVLYVAHATQVPTIFQSLSLGYMAHYYHQVLLVMTDTRIFEILLNLRATEPETRIRSYTWAQVRDLRLRFGRLLVTPANGKKQAWRLRVSGDKKLLKLLLPRVSEHLLNAGSGGTPVVQPAWHCPECGSESANRPTRCSSCSALFRSPRLAAWLSFAFPGAGLFYAGHPVLAVLDFLGEVILFGLFAAALAAAAGMAETIALVGMGLFFFLMTKFESLHIGHILVTRTRPESQARYAGFRRFAIAGGLLSVLALTGAGLAAGSLRQLVDRDLRLTTVDGSWSDGGNQAEWEFFMDDASARSQWTHTSGIVMTLFAYPVSTTAEQEQFRRDFTETMAKEGRVLLIDDRLPGDRKGFRHLIETRDEDGDPITSFNYFVYDTEMRDIHQLFTAVPSSMQDEAEVIIEEFVANTEWTEPVTPAP